MSEIQFQPPYTIRTARLPEVSQENNEVSVGNWLITLLILLIPLFNTIMLFVWSFSLNTNPSKRNFSRAMLISSIVCYSIIISLICLYFITNLYFL